jgi:hypothetical protein
VLYHCANPNPIPSFYKLKKRLRKAGDSPKSWRRAGKNGILLCHILGYLWINFSVLGLFPGLCRNLHVILTPG